MRERGFSLLETLVASVLIAGAIGTLLHLVMRSSAQSVSSELASVALTLAQAKLEALRAERFSFDANGNRIDAAALTTASDRLGRFGEPTIVEAEAAYARRWSVSQWAADPDVLVMSVCVDAIGHRAVPLPPACVWTLRARQP